MSKNKYGYHGKGRGNSSTHSNPCRGGCGRYTIYRYCKKCNEDFKEGRT